MIPLHDERRSHLTPWVVRAVVLICVAVYFYQLTLIGRAEGLFFYQYGLTPASFFGAAELSDDVAVIHPWLTLLTTMFVHGGFVHLLGNMLFLWTFGDNIEDSMGHVRFAVFFLLTGAIAALCHAGWDMDAQVPLVGASGAIAGVLGGYILLYPRSRILVGIPLGPLFLPIRLRAWLLIGIWFALQILNVLGNGVDGGGTAWLAHIGGFAAGLVLLPLFKRRDRKLFSSETDMAVSEQTKPMALKVMRPDPHPCAPAPKGPWG